MSLRYMRLVVSLHGKQFQWGIWLSILLFFLAFYFQLSPYFSLFILHFFMIQSIAQKQEAVQIHRFIFSLPMSRRAYVVSYYMFILIFIGVITLILWVVNYVLQLFFTDTYLNDRIVTVLVIIAMFSVIIYSFLTPLFYHLKTNTIEARLIASLMLLLIWIVSLIGNPMQGYAIEQFEEQPTNILGLFVISLISFVVSMVMSQQILAKKPEL